GGRQVARDRRVLSAPRGGSREQASAARYAPQIGAQRERRDALLRGQVHASLCVQRLQLGLTLRDLSQPFVRAPLERGGHQPVAGIDGIELTLCPRGLETRLLECQFELPPLDV